MCHWHPYIPQLKVEPSHNTMRYLLQLPNKNTLSHNCSAGFDSQPYFSPGSLNLTTLWSFSLQTTNAYIGQSEADLSLAQFIHLKEKLFCHLVQCLHFFLHHPYLYMDHTSTGFNSKNDGAAPLVKRIRATSPSIWTRDIKDEEIFRQTSFPVTSESKERKLYNLRSGWQKWWSRLRKEQ